MLNITDYVDAYRAKPSKRNVHLRIAVLWLKFSLNSGLCIRELHACDLQDTSLRQHHSALTVYREHEVLCHSAPNVEIQAITRPQHVVRSRRQVDIASVNGSYTENIGSESLKLLFRNRNLLVKVTKGWKIAVRTGICFLLGSRSQIRVLLRSRPAGRSLPRSPVCC